MDNAAQKNIVLVLGMHRSGTSAITRGLQVLGVDLGDRLMPPLSGSNEKGFFEDAEISSFDEDLLHHLGHEWHSLAPILPKEMATPEIAEFKLRAIELLKKKMSLTECLGLKDPRISRLLPFWKDIFDQLNVRVSYIIASRNPMSVAQSLAKRDGFALEKGYYLWIDSMLSTLIQTENQTRIVVDYDRLMENPELQLKRMAHSLGLDFNPECQKFIEYQKQFLEGSLRHTRYDLEDLKHNEVVPPNVVELYQILSELAVDSVKFDGDRVNLIINRIGEQMKDNYVALRYMRTCEDRKIEVVQQMAELEKKMDEISQQINSANNQLDTILSSQSWKLTRPFRKALKFIRLLKSSNKR